MMHSLLRRSLLVFIAGMAWAATSAPAAAPIREKTLVVWAAPANLDQRGGSALTIEDGEDHFDAVVLGEIAPRKWMAGSDYYSRTLRDQSAVAEESAAAGKFVQIAVVYREKEVIVYRDGLEYSRHVPAKPLQEFGPRSFVGIGKRHRHQGEGARFAGSIEDARIYAQALTAEEIRSLRPDTQSALRPLAWWTFDDASTGDRMGRFPLTQVSGGAKIAHGRLELDGKTGGALFRLEPEPPFVPETPARPDPVPPGWLTFHLAHPGPGTAMPGDPNCAFYWKGRYHLHYIYAHKDGFAFAHVSSTDLIHWKWHPTTLTPSKTEHGMFSGTGFFTKEGRPAIIYHGQGSGRNQIALALDDQLEQWTKPMAVEPVIHPGQDASKIANWDPDAWLDGDAYYALSGGSPGSGKPPTLFKSQDLKSWDYLGLFLDHDMPDVQKDEDISCPNFFKIGGRDMLLCISHNKGCRYYLGRWQNEKFTPDFHARMNWKGWDCFAPESLLTRDGRRVMWAWCNLGAPQSGIQSLPRELSLPADGRLRIRPLRELETLRTDARRQRAMLLAGGESRLLPGIAGDSLELRAVMRPGPAGRSGLEVHAGETAGTGLLIVVDPIAHSLTVGETRAPFVLESGETLELRVFVDRNMVEVFANDRQAVVASHPYDVKQVGVRVLSQGGSTRVEQVRAWRMKSIYGR